MAACQSKRLPRFRSTSRFRPCILNLPSRFCSPSPNFLSFHRCAGVCFRQLAESGRVTRPKKRVTGRAVPFRSGNLNRRPHAACLRWTMPRDQGSLCISVTPRPSALGPQTLIQIRMGDCEPLTVSAEPALLCRCASAPFHSHSHSDCFGAPCSAASMAAVQRADDVGESRVRARVEAGCTGHPLRGASSRQPAATRCAREQRRRGRPARGSEGGEAAPTRLPAQRMDGRRRMRQSRAERGNNGAHSPLH